MKHWKWRWMLVISFMLTGVSSFSQVWPTILFQQQVEMATGMRSNGKIYVVVAVLSMILTGLFIYLILLDRKISKLEKERNK